MDMLLNYTCSDSDSNEDEGSYRVAINENTNYDTPIPDQKSSGKAFARMQSKEDNDNDFFALNDEDSSDDEDAILPNRLSDHSVNGKSRKRIRG